MSVYYMFYLAKKFEAGMTVVAPAIMTENGKFKIVPAISRSKSFIDADEWCRLMSPLSLEDINQEPSNLRLLASDRSWGPTPNIQSDSYYIPFSEVINIAAKDRAGLRIGYASLEEVNYVAKHDYYLEDKYEIDFLSADVVAEMQLEDRKKYGKVAFLETNSMGYIANQIVDAFHEFVYDDDYYVVCVIG